MFSVSSRSARYLQKKSSTAYSVLGSGGGGVRGSWTIIGTVNESEGNGPCTVGSGI